MKMHLTLCILALLLVHLGFLGAYKAPPAKPSWPKTYFVQGILELPYAEIKEPFTAYYDSIKMRSRIDYYGDMVYTKQQASVDKKSYGQSFKVAPMSTEKAFNTKTCFLVNGTKDAAVETQSVLPDLKDFMYVGEDKSTNAYMWQTTNKVGNKKNTYTLWVDKDNAHPVRYEMIGFDSLLGSHYDRYYLTYANFSKNITDKSFDLPSGMTPKQCSGFPGPGDMEHRVTMNPMTEYIGQEDRHIDQMFDHFKRKHGKTYKSNTEHMERKHIFRHNVRFIHSKNRAGLGFSLAVNHLTDLTDHEFSQMRGYRHSGEPSQALPFNMHQFDLKRVPDSLDWRLFGAVTPVKDQAVCGSCWSFGTSGHVEGAYFLKTGELVRLSQQELMDCSWGEGNNACDGGEDFRAYDWIMQHGLATEADYGPYLAQDGYCRNVSGKAFVESYVNITSGSLQALKVAMVNQGPISVGIDAAHKEFSFYSNGVYYNPQCGSGPDDLDHAVLAVGYGIMNGEAYWLVKNSWSTYWGNDGYVLMAQRNNNCGVATAATYVNIKANF